MDDGSIQRVVKAITPMVPPMIRRDDSSAQKPGGGISKMSLSKNIYAMAINPKTWSKVDVNNFDIKFTLRRS